MAAREEGGLPARCISLLEEVKGLLEGQDNNTRNMNESGVRLVNDAGAITSDVARGASLAPCFSIYALMIYHMHFKILYQIPSFFQMVPLAYSSQVLEGSGLTPTNF